MEFVDDVHCRFSRTKVRSVMDVGSVEDIRKGIALCKENGWRLSIAGGRHSLGRQPFVTDGVVLDMGRFNQVLSLDLDRGIIRMQGGIMWPDVKRYLAEMEGEHGERKWEIHQKQTGADWLSVAGAISVNAHGNVLDRGPISRDVVWLKIVNFEGREVYCDRTCNPELFALVVGGFGLFGVVSEIGLQLVAPQCFVRRSSVRSVDQVLEEWDTVIKNFDYGDMQLDINGESSSFLDRGILNLWEPTDSEPPAAGPAAPDWEKLLALAHLDKPAAFREYSRYAEAIDGSLARRDDFHWQSYEEGYHERFEQMFSMPRGGDILAEFFIAKDKLRPLLLHARKGARELRIDLVLATLRAIRRCEVSFLRWAKADFVCLVLALHVEHSEEQIERADAFCASLCHFCCTNEGSFYLPYRSFANRNDFKLAYPNFDEFVRQKIERDPVDLFGNDWFDRVRSWACL